MNPGFRFAHPGANLPPARAGFARRRRARRLARGERAKRATPGTWPHENRTPTGVRGGELMWRLTDFLEASTRAALRLIERLYSLIVPL